MTDFGSLRKPPMAARISFFVAQLRIYATAEGSQDFYKLCLPQAIQWVRLCIRYDRKFLPF